VFKKGAAGVMELWGAAAWEAPAIG